MNQPLAKEEVDELIAEAKLAFRRHCLPSTLYYIQKLENYNTNEVENKELALLYEESRCACKCCVQRLADVESIRESKSATSGSRLVFQLKEADEELAEQITGLRRDIRSEARETEEQGALLTEIKRLQAENNDLRERYKSGIENGSETENERNKHEIVQQFDIAEDKRVMKLEANEGEESEEFTTPESPNNVLTLSFEYDSVVTNSEYTAEDVQELSMKYNELKRLYSERAEQSNIQLVEEEKELESLASKLEEYEEELSEYKVRLASAQPNIHTFLINDEVMVSKAMPELQIPEMCAHRTISTKLISQAHNEEEAVLLGSEITREDIQLSMITELQNVLEGTYELRQIVSILKVYLHDHEKENSACIQETCKLVEVALIGGKDNIEILFAKFSKSHNRQPAQNQEYIMENGVFNAEAEAHEEEKQELLREIESLKERLRNSEIICGNYKKRCEATEIGAQRSLKDLMENKLELERCQMQEQLQRSAYEQIDLFVAREFDFSNSTQVPVSVAEDCKLAAEALSKETALTSQAFEVLLLEFEELETLLRLIGRSYSDIKTENQELEQSALEEEEQAHEQSRSNIESLKRQLNDAEDEILLLSNDKSELQLELSSAESEADRLQKELGESVDRLSLKEECSEEEERTIRKLNGQVTELQDQNDGYQQELLEYQETNDRIASTEEQCYELAAENRELSEQLKEGSCNATTLETRLSESEKDKQTLILQCTQLTSEVSRLRTTEEQLRTTEAQLRQVESTKAELREQMQCQDAEIMEEEATENVIMELLNDLKGGFVSLGSNCSQFVLFWNDHFEAKICEPDLSLVACGNVAELIEEMIQLAQRFSAVLVESKEQFKIISERNTQTVASLSEMQTLCDELQRKVTELTEQCNTKESTLQEQNEALSNQKIEIETYAAALEEENLNLEQHEEMTSEIVNMSTTLENKDLEIERLAESFQQLQGEMESNAAELNQQIIAYNDVENSLEAAQDELEVVENKNQRVIEENDVLREQSSTLREQIVELASQLSSLQENHRVLQLEKSSAESDLASERARISRLLDEMQASRQFTG